VDILVGMSEVTAILSQIGQGDCAAAEHLLPLVYNELRKLAAAKLAGENKAQTLQATALVHEAYLRLLGPANQAGFDGRNHFFAAAAEAMRRILVENARRKRGLKRGGGAKRADLDEGLVAFADRSLELLDLDDALTVLERHDLTAAQLVKLRYFVGFGHTEAAEALGIGRREADRLWALARAWLYQQLSDSHA
jgi:RNA polymerase sigma factor (TIGR02999 family)